MARKRRRNDRYSDQDKARAMSIAEISSKEEAIRVTGVPRNTLDRWIKGGQGGAYEEVEALRNQYRNNLADFLESVVWEMAGKIMEKWPEATMDEVKDCMDSITKNIQLLRGKATGVTARVELNEQDFLDGLKKLAGEETPGPAPHLEYQVQAPAPVGAGVPDSLPVPGPEGGDSGDHAGGGAEQAPVVPLPQQPASEGNGLPG